jgi:thiol:disulfide interchange protein DsbD
MTLLLTLLAFQPVLAKAELVSSHKSITPGTTFEVALRLTPEEGWHTYWKNPGDNGMPTQVKWTLPKGWIAGPLRFSIPETIVDSSGTSFGYSDERYFSAKITVPKGFKAGPANIGAAASWMVCKDLCMPGSAKLSYKITVGKATVASADSGSLAKMTWPSGGPGGTATLANKVWVVNLPSSLPSKPLKRFFPADSGVVDHSQAGTIRDMTLRVGASPFMSKAPERFKGLVVFEDDTAFEIDAPVSTSKGE